MREPCDTIDYGAASIKEALQLWGDDAPDPDSDRRADLERALACLSDPEAHALRLWSWGFPASEIAARVLPGKKRMTASRFVARAFAALRNEMNGTVRGKA